MEQTIEPLNRVFLQFGPFTIYWYAVFIVSGALLGLWVATREAKRRGLHQDLFVDLVMWAIPIAIISARAYYVLFEWEYYAEHPDQIYKIWEGGLAIHGALIGSVITAVLFTRKRGVSFWKVADIAAPSIILGQAIGRWGNFMNQEAHGGEVSRQFLEGLHLPDFIINQMYIEGAYWHPTFLYESIWNIVGFGILLLLRRVNLGRGEMFLSYIIWYSIGRFFIEGMRTDSLMVGGELRAAQMISIVLVVGSIALWVYRRIKGYSKARYLDDAA